MWAAASHNLFKQTFQSWMLLRLRVASIVVAALAVVVACRSESTSQSKDAGAEPAPKSDVRPRPVVLYLPDGGDVAPAPRPPMLGEPMGRGGLCPPEMVSIAAEFCIDRYEASLVDTATGRELSPYYPPDKALAVATFRRFSRLAPQAPTLEFSGLDVPLLPAWQSSGRFSAKATSRRGVVPSSYLSGLTAQIACEAAGKRVCSRDEWLKACRGQEQRKFPYGDSYIHGQCNVFREAHPAVLLHGNASIYHHDPRLNTLAPNGKPLLRSTGSTPECGSSWGDDAVYDMVGNLDEWVDDVAGAFQGGFYARSTREGCDARISSHAPAYYDYSLGTRCCR